MIRPPRINLDYKIVILNDGVDDAELVAMLREFLTRRLAMPVRIENNHFPFDDAHRPQRQQWDYSVMLQRLHERVQGTGRCLLLTRKDTFGESRSNWSTGIAACPGSVAVVSVCRLNPVFWGAMANRELYYRRVRKIALHELGHTFDRAGHCDDGRCVIYQLDSLEAIDQTGDDFCARCNAVVQPALAASQK